MPEITCGLDAVTNPTTCNDRGGIRALYWFEVDDVDWADMLGDALKFDPATQQILEFTMISGATMSKLTFERKEAFYDFTYTRDADVYELLLTLFFKGKENARKNSLQKAIACCNIGLLIFTNEGTQRVVAKDYNGVVFDDILEYTKVTRHLDSSGQLGSSKARDELDLGGQSFYAPLFANVDESALPLV